jgi:hypothetical protein
MVEISTVLGIVGGAAFILGILMLLAGLITIIMVIVGLVAIVVFLSTRKVLLPKVTLFILNLLEGPISYIVGFFVNDDVVSKMIVDIRNDLFRGRFYSIPYNERFLFLPHCLRHNDCPARSTHDGLKCVECGKCSISEIKKGAEKLGYKVFIVPGASLLKLIVKKYKPKAVFGVGCIMEVKEGSEKMASYGLPVQGLLLDKDGCMSTVVNVKELLKRLK